ncbi:MULTISPECIES: LysR family transcriptional regulator [Pseudomonas]|uniref:LysR family transcriptional regulator n=1 Tax=Pseudomonas nitroreducens TaxID=46680 RepID=A0A6G6J9E4_PSENT|nr:MULTISPECIES: LysR family transcriptional regulator [Pseudomonas]QIE91101.1 LysR family transcriptional regulator [Pseudomonas nitroreducens]UCL90247.1 LysR family transcriptional regulator [Pseudomonas sp. HS-18]
MLEQNPIDRQLAQTFLTCARCGCFRQAARVLNQHIVPMRKKLKKLEVGIGSPLFRYENRSLHLTAAGEALREYLIGCFSEIDLEVPQSHRRQIRLAVPTDLLDDILARDLISWARKDAGMHLLIVPQDGMPETPADVTIWMSDLDSPRPDPGFALTRPRLLAQIDYRVHIATRYAGSKAPTTLQELDDFMLVQRSMNSSIAAFEPWNRLLDQRKSAVTRVHSQSWVRELIRNAGGIGLLPSYTVHLEKNLRAIPQVFSRPIERSAWISLSPLVAQEADVDALASVVLQAFKQRSEWFV